MWKLSISATNSHFKWRKKRSKNRHTFQIAQIHHFQKINFDAEIFAFWFPLYCAKFTCCSASSKFSKKKPQKSKNTKCSLYDQSGFESLVFMIYRRSCSQLYIFDAFIYLCCLFAHALYIHTYANDDGYDSPLLNMPIIVFVYCTHYSFYSLPFNVHNEVEREQSVLFSVCVPVPHTQPHPVNSFQSKCSFNHRFKWPLEMTDISFKCLKTAKAHRLCSSPFVRCCCSLSLLLLLLFKSLEENQIGLDGPLLC